MEFVDLNLSLRYWVRRSIGHYLPRYNNAKEMFFYLKKTVPSFLSERFVDKPPDKRLLITSMGWYDAKTEAIYAKTLEALGYEAHVITPYDPFVAECFNLFGIRNIYFYEDYHKKCPSGQIRAEAESCIQNSTDEDILKLTRNGIHVGKYAASSAMRRTRRSSFDLKDNTMHSLFVEQLFHSLRAAASAEAILKQIKPDLLWVNDRGYTPVGELFDACINQGIPVIQRCASHKSGSEILKQYSAPDKSSIHPHSLSAESREYVRKIPRGEGLQQGLFTELERTYRSGDWFSEAGTQFNKVIYPKKDLVSKLQLDLGKKTAVIFPHMFWDATFFWGEDLFKDYYDWFVETLKVAAENKSLNWIIKIHPANVIKAKRDNYHGEHVELKAVYETFGQLPDHFRVIPPESDINTFNLFAVMDYCLTVRGTIGIEASALGINTLTAGTGRYGRLGFTYDFDSREDYLACIRSLQDLPPMTEEKKELASRYAYGIFVLRPIKLDLLEHGFNNDERGTMRFRPLFRNRDEFEKSSFVAGLRDFVLSGREDYLNLQLNTSPSVPWRDIS